MNVKRSRPYEANGVKELPAARLAIRFFGCFLLMFQTNASARPTSLTARLGDAMKPPAVVAAEIEVRSRPDGADILLDEAFVGNTPSTIGVSAGDHAIAIKKIGFKTWRKNIRVTSGKITLTAELEPGIDPP